MGTMKSRKTDPQIVHEYRMANDPTYRARMDRRMAWGARQEEKLARTRARAAEVRAGIEERKRNPHPWSVQAWLNRRAARKAAAAEK